MKEYSINKNLSSPLLDVMNFLGEIDIEYPGAISFAAGNPNNKHLDVKEIMSGFDLFVQSYSKDKTVYGYNEIGQYTKTNGIISEHIARFISKDESINVDPYYIMSTNGAHEAIAIIINTIFNDDNDILLVSDPIYTGFFGNAKIFNMPITCVKRDADSIDLDHLENVLIQLIAEKKSPKVLYEVVDFHNPTGTYMPLEKRRRLIELAEKYNFFIVEDNPYGYFKYDGEKIPTLKALDRFKRVIYVGSFSKSLFPGLRLGYIVADQEFFQQGKTIRLIEELKKVKSFLSIHTSNIIQAIVGGFLIKNNYTLCEYIKPKVETAMHARNCMLEALSYYFPPEESWTKGINWSRPKGGFFLILDIPFNVTKKLLTTCVEQYSVIFCPLSFFSVTGDTYLNQIRLSFSCVTPDEIKNGIKQLSLFIRSVIEKA